MRTCGLLFLFATDIATKHYKRDRCLNNSVDRWSTSVHGRAWYRISWPIHGVASPTQPTRAELWDTRTVARLMVFIGLQAGRGGVSLSAQRRLQVDAAAAGLELLIEQLPCLH